MWSMQPSKATSMIPLPLPQTPRGCPTILLESAPRQCYVDLGHMSGYARRESHVSVPSVAYGMTMVIPYGA